MTVAKHRLALTGILFAFVASGCSNGSTPSGDATAACPSTDKQQFSAWGDSLTWGRSAGDYVGGYPAYLSDLIGQPVYNGGVPGEKAPGIAARQGGKPAPATVVGGSIPESGPVQVILRDRVVIIRDEGTLDGTIQGIHGTLFKEDHSFQRTPYYFSRSNPGEETAVPRGTPFIPDVGAMYRSSTQIYWYGRNDAAVGHQNVSSVIPAVAASVAYIRPCTDHYLVMSTINRDGEEEGTSTYELINNLNAQLEDAYMPGHYLDIRAYLIRHGLVDAGITPTADDRQDMANDVVPRSLRVADSIHLTNTGYELVAEQIYRFMTDNKWVD